MAGKYLQNQRVSKKKTSKRWRYVIIALVVLICLVSVACFLWFNRDKPAETSLTKEETYISVCEANGFSIFQQEVTEKSTAGIVKGYISTAPSASSQFDYYEFENEEFTTNAYKRIVGWVMVHYGDRSYAGSTIEGDEWILQTDEVYFRAVKQGNILTYILCTDSENIEHVANILEEVAGA